MSDALSALACFAGAWVALDGARQAGEAGMERLSLTFGFTFFGLLLLGLWHLALDVFA
jgi:hypothetical protein